MSAASIGELVQAVPLLRRKLPAEPDELNPVPPLAGGITPRRALLSVPEAMLLALIFVRFDPLAVKLPVTLSVPGI